MKDFMKAQAIYLVGSAMSVIGMFGGMWLWSEVLQPKAEELKKKHTKDVSETEEGLD